MLDPVERDFIALSRSASYTEDFDEAVNDRVQEEVDKFFDDLVVDDVEAYMDSDDESVSYTHLTLPTICSV